MSDETIFTTGETLTDPADQHGSADLTPEDLRALDGLHSSLARDSVNAREVYGAPQSRQRTEPEDSTYIRRIQDSIEPWHSVSPQPAVLAAREALAAAIEADKVARRAWAELPAREAAERKAVSRAAVAGEEVPALTDWSRERLVALARHAVLARETKAAAKAYENAVRSSLSAWREALVAEVASARQEALEVFKGVEAAVQRLEKIKQAAHAVDAAAFPDDAIALPPLPREVQETLNRGRGAARALAAYLNSDHPVITGEVLRREGPQLNPPMFVREALPEGGASAWSQLISIEIAENFKHSAFIRAEAERYVPDAYGDLRSRDPRSGDLGWEREGLLVQ